MIKVHDTLTGHTIELSPLHKGRINMFVCGPTVYDQSHIGHARTYIFFDTVAKFLRRRGYSVFYLQNITDIDDKIINKAKEEGLKVSEVAEHYLSEYLEDMKALRVDGVTLYAKATLHMEEIISQIKRLQDAGFAYEVEDGVYFDVEKFQDYGKLSKQKLSEIWHGARVDINEMKKNPADFVLWKKQKPGEPFWESPWGRGRPGWHIEDTAITETYFGPEYDIHGGGSDLIFPHHEAEIAQMRSISGLDNLSRIWIHSGMLNINAEKMSKSLKNIRTIKELLQSFSAEEIRFAFLNANYRSILDFSDDLMQVSRETLSHVQTLYNKLKKIEREKGEYEVDPEKIISELAELMENDFDTRSLITRLLAFVSELNRNIDGLSKEQAKNAISVLEWSNSFLSIIGTDREFAGISRLVDSVLDIRRNLRKEKRFDLSDMIRAELKSAGIYIEDQNDKTIWWFSEE